MPPTVPATRNTNSGWFALNQCETSDWSRRSSWSRDAVRMLVNPALLQPANECRPDQAAMAGYKNPGILLHLDYQRGLQGDSRRDEDVIKVPATFGSSAGSDVRTGADAAQDAHQPCRWRSPRR
jgi:hypothetical protein